VQVILPSPAITGEDEMEGAGVTWGDTQIRLAVKRNQARGAGDLARNPIEDIGTEEE
jgi:hypothetical protein